MLEQRAFGYFGYVATTCVCLLKPRKQHKSCLTRRAASRAPLPTADHHESETRFVKIPKCAFRVGRRCDARRKGGQRTLSGLLFVLVFLRCDGTTVRRKRAGAGSPPP